MAQEPIHLQRTDAADLDFQALVLELDRELAIRDGAEHAFYAQYNSILQIPFVVLACSPERPAGCGALKPYDAETLEVKRMYVPPDLRGRGIASAVLQELERWACELGYKRCILETGLKQPEAIALYRKNGYREIPNYGQYAGIDNSVCFEKRFA